MLDQAPTDTENAARSGRPTIDELVAAMCSEIESGRRGGGSRLPSVRRFARESGASRYAVVEAYERLVASGLVVSRPGSGFFVGSRRAHAPRRQERPAAQARAFGVASLIRDVLESDGKLLKLGGPWLPEDWLDAAAMQSIARSLGRGAATHLFRYGLPKGYLPLRDLWRGNLAEIGVEATAEQIVLTNGSSHAFDLIIRKFLQPGDTVLVEDPGYYNLFGYLRLCGVRLVGVPRRTDGPDIQALRAAAALHNPKLFILQSVLHNPTGTDIAPKGLYRILQAAAEFGFRVVEDDTYGDLSETVRPRLATLDQLDRVIYVRSCSKTLSGSMRSGMIAAAPDLVEELTNVKVLSSISSSEFVERFIYRMQIEGHYRKFIERVKVRLADSRGAAQRLLSSHGMEIFAAPAGGNFLWARFPDVEDSASLLPAARERGILLGPGRSFRPNLEPSPWMRINVTMCDDPRLPEFLRSRTGSIPLSAS